MKEASDTQQQQITNTKKTIKKLKKINGCRIGLNDVYKLKLKGL